MSPALLDVLAVLCERPYSIEPWTWLLRETWHPALRHHRRADVHAAVLQGLSLHLIDLLPSWSPRGLPCRVRCAPRLAITEAGRAWLRASRCGRAAA